MCAGSPAAGPRAISRAQNYLGMLTPDQLNYLVYRYLLEAGYQHTAFSMSGETGVLDLGISPEQVPVASLVGLVQRGLQLADIELHTDASGQLHLCDQEFDLFTPHTCLNAERLVLDAEAEDGRRALARELGSVPDQHLRSGISVGEPHLGAPEGGSAAFGEEGGRSEEDASGSGEDFSEQEPVGVSSMERSYIRALAGLFGRLGGERTPRQAPRIEPLDTREEAYLSSRGLDAKRRPISRYYADLRSLVPELRDHVGEYAGGYPGAYLGGYAAGYQGGYPGHYPGPYSGAYSGMYPGAYPGAYPGYSARGFPGAPPGPLGFRRFHAGRRAFSFCRRTPLGVVACEFGRVFVLRLQGYPRNLEVTELELPPPWPLGQPAPQGVEKLTSICAAAWSDRRGELALLMPNARLVVMAVEGPGSQQGAKHGSSQAAQSAQAAQGAQAAQQSDSQTAAQAPPQPAAQGSPQTSPQTASQAAQSAQPAQAAQAAQASPSAASAQPAHPSQSTQPAQPAQPVDTRIRASLLYNGHPFGLLQEGRLMYSPSGDYLLYYGSTPRPYLFCPALGRLIDSFSPMQLRSSAIGEQTPCSAMLCPSPQEHYTAMSALASDPVLYFDACQQAPGRREACYQFPFPGSDFYIQLGRGEKLDRAGSFSGAGAATGPGLAAGLSAGTGAGVSPALPSAASPSLSAEPRSAASTEPRSGIGAAPSASSPPPPTLHPLYKDEETPRRPLGAARFAAAGRRPVTTACAWISDGEYVYVRTDGWLFIERVPMLFMEGGSPFRALASNSPMSGVLFQARLCAEPLLGVHAALLPGPSLQIYAYTAQGWAHSLHIVGPVAEARPEEGQRWKNVKTASFSVCKGAITASALLQSSADCRADLLLGDEFGYVHCLGSEMRFIRWNTHVFNQPVTSLECVEGNVLCGSRKGFSRVLTSEGAPLPMYKAGSGAVVASLAAKAEAEPEEGERSALWCSLSRDGLFSMSVLADVFPSREE